MRRWNHDELHHLIDTNPQLKVKSEAVHALPKPVSFEEAETQKLQMLEIYVEAIGCRQLVNAQSECQEVYSYLKTHYVWGEDRTLTIDDWKAINTIARGYATKRRCHAPKGNDFVCYCMQ